MIRVAMLKSTACRSSYGRLTYIFNQTAHSTAKTDHRVLACSGTNINMLHNPSGQITAVQSGAYLEKQFHQSLKRAYNPKRKYQAQSIIISFSNDEFDTSNLKVQSIQALQLVQGYVHQHFSDAQSVACVQCDGDGGRLHVHLLINAVKKSGKTVPTSRFTVYRMRKDWNKYLEHHFQQVTGRQWHNPFEQAKQREDIKALPTRSSWEVQLKKTIDQVKQEVHTITDFLAHLSVKGIKVKERGKKKRWTYTQIVPNMAGKPKLRRIRAFYQRKDKSGHVLSTRGLGEAYTRQGLEDYWQQQEKEQVLVPTSKHTRKDVHKHGKQDVQSQDEELIKVKTIAKEAQAAINQRRLRNQFTFRQLKAAEAQEQQQGVKFQTGSATQGWSKQGRSHSASQQSGREEATQRHVREQQERAKRTNGKDGGPNY